MHLSHSEVEEVQDNFREDEVDEYRHLKRDLETASKNCRVLQFKLKKAEKSIIDLSSEKSDMEWKFARSEYITCYHGHK